MQTVTIDIINNKAFKLLQDLELLQLIRLRTDKPNTIPQKTKLSDKYRGVFSKEDAKSFNDHTQQMRKEWDNT